MIAASRQRPRAELLASGLGLVLFVVTSLAACQVRVGEEATAPGEKPKADHGPVAEKNVIVEIAAGSRHTCARRNAGDVICWGTNDHGQLGDGSTKSRGNPVAIAGLDDVEQIVAGERHACARREDGKVLCWGSNEHGQVGDATGRPGAIRKSPAPVRGLEDAVAIASGARHVCAIRKAGSVLCWGDNRDGQLQNRARKVWVAPVIVKAAAGATRIAAGSGHTCILRKEGTVECWGSNAQGQLGDGTTRSRVQTRPVQGVRDAVDLAAGGSRTCAMHKGGRTTCWGRGARGPVPSPKTVAGLQDAAQLGIGDDHVCARTRRGVVLCWGGNDDGRLGDGSTERRSTPTRVRRLTDATHIAAGTAHTCAVRRSGGAACWGSNAGGALGDGTLGSPHRTSPAVARGLVDAAQVRAGTAFTCARRGDGHVLCWGENTVGQLGDGSKVDRSEAGEVLGLDDAVSLAAGGTHACAVREAREGGTVVCWGGNAFGQLGDGSRIDRSRPVVVKDLRHAKAIVAGARHTCAILEARRGSSVACWGDNELGQLGGGKKTGGRTEVAGLGDAIALTAGSAHTCALRRGGRVSCWGHNLYGQLGDGSGAAELGKPRLEPVSVARVSDATSVFAGAFHTCALRSGGAVFCWGRGDGGRLGSGTTAHWTTRVPVRDLVDVQAAAAGRDHTCALQRGGQIRCWGANDSLQLGDSSEKSRPVPVAGPRLPEAVELAAGAHHTCARLRSGRILCWGSDERGQIGDGGVLQASVPVDVKLP